MSTIKTFEDLIAWQKAHAFVLDVYRVTKEPCYQLFLAHAVRNKNS